jgi:hypothetical protein
MAMSVRGGALLLILAAVGCGGSSGGSTSGDCATIPWADNTTAGCTIRLAQPVGCQTVDLTGGKTYTFEWTGSGCATPWELCVGGSPANFTTTPMSNAGCVQVNINGSNVTTTTGIISFSAADIAASGLTSTSGVYYWTVRSWYGSHPATQAVKIVK